MKRKIFSIILIVISLILLGSSLLLIMIKLSEQKLQSVEYDVFFIVDDIKGVGVDVNSSVLTFGRTSPGGSGVTRPVLVTNNYEFPIEVRVFLSENVINVLEVNASYEVARGKNISIPIRLNIPEGFPLGTYEGKARFDLFKIEK